MKIQHRQNFYAGLMFVLFGVTAMVLSHRTLDIGPAANMGPGFFPYYLGALPDWSEVTATATPTPA